MRHRIAAHNEQFERIIKTGCIWLSFWNQWPDFIQIIAKNFRGHAFFARGHPVNIATNSINLTIVGNHPEGMRQVPCWEGVGGETLVN